MRKSILVALLCFASWATLAAQVDEDALFEEPLITNDAPDASAADASPTADDAGSAPGFEPRTRVGGSFTTGVDGQYAWEDPQSLGDVLDWPDGAATTNLAARLYIDSRPAESFRVYGEAVVSYPFLQNAEREFDDILTMTELFSDFNTGDLIFVRAGKHTVTWGVGYFFSPADIINIERINPREPELDREGPVSARFQYARPESNLYLYVLPPAGEREQFVWAPKAEVALGRFEIGIGAYAERTNGFTAMLTGTGSVRRVNIFGEVVLEDASDRTFVRDVEVSLENPLGLGTYADDSAVVSATAGARYALRNPSGQYGIQVIGQYFYNGDGYEDSAILRKDQAGVAALLADGTLSAPDLVETGRHYAAAVVSWRDILNSDFSASVSWYGNITEAAGRAAGALTVQPWERVRLEGELAWVYGETGSELAPNGNRLEVEWAVSLGSGAF